MRVPNLGSVSYTPAPLPASIDPVIQLYIRDELLALAGVIRLLADGQVDMIHVAPPKPRDGMIRLADGIDWDPGSGTGLYCYYSTTWNKLG